MTATITVREALWRVGTVLQDLAPQFTRHPEAELVNWLNDAQLALVKFLPSSAARRDVVKLKAGTRQSIESIAAADCKPGDGSTPAAAILGIQLLDVVRNMGADGLTPGKSIRVVQREILDSQTRNWHQITGPAVDQFTFDPATPRYFYVTPGVVGNVWVELAYTAQPTRITAPATPGTELYRYDGANNTLLSLPDEFIDDIVNYVVARAYMKNAQFAGDGGKASTFISMFTGSLNAKVAALTGTSPNLKFLPFAPEPVGAAK